MHHFNLFAALILAVASWTFQPRTTEGQEAKTPVKVFILAGQSNMQGHGRIEMGKDGDLGYAAKQERFAYLKEGENWAERDDVWFFHKTGKGQVRIHKSRVVVL